MKQLLLFTLLLMSMAVTAQEGKSSEKKPEEQIRKYWFVMLTRGTNRSHDSVTAAKIQQAHLANIDRLYNEGKLKVAGPFGGGGQWVGLFILDCATKEEAEELVKTDPAIAAGRLAYEIRAWYTAPIGSFVPGKPKTPLF
jgi:uncharacterized protein